ncbi:hypothetical protein LTR22_021139 [Elasticomyces elasticus]|nr:hypothetical protein LTR22_021139 [Elasticomyces elasticus]
MSISISFDQNLEGSAYQLTHTSDFTLYQCMVKVCRTPPTGYESNMDACLAEMENLKIGELEPVTGVTFSCDTSGTHTSSQTCKLLTIAPELRNKTYELALSEVNTGLVDLLSAGSPSNKNLLLSCRQVYEEAKGIHAEAYRRYWSETNFVLRHANRIYCRTGTERSMLPVSFTAEDLAQVRHLQFSATFRMLQYHIYPSSHVMLPAHIPDNCVYGFRRLFDRLPEFGEWWCAPTAAEPSRRLQVGEHGFDHLEADYKEEGLKKPQWADGRFCPINSDELGALMVSEVVHKGSLAWDRMVGSEEEFRDITKLHTLPLAHHNNNIQQSSAPPTSNVGNGKTRWLLKIAPLLASNADFAAPITQSSTFLTIPAEIRNDTYERAFNKLWKTGVDRLSGKSYIRSENVDLFKAAPPSKAPLLVCRQMNNEAKGLYETAYRSYWKEVSFYVYMPEKYDRFTQFSEEDLHHIRHLELHITFHELHMLLWDEYYVSPYSRSPDCAGHYLDYDRVATGQWLLSHVDGERVDGQRSEDYGLVLELYKDKMISHDDVEPYARGHAFKSIEKKELEALFEHKLQLKVRQE